MLILKNIFTLLLQNLMLYRIWIKYEPKGCKLKPLNSLNHAVKTSINVNNEIEDIDIAFIDITEKFEEYQAF